MPGTKAVFEIIKNGKLSLVHDILTFCLIDFSKNNSRIWQRPKLPLKLSKWLIVIGP